MSNDTYKFDDALRAYKALFWALDLAWMGLLTEFTETVCKLAPDDLDLDADADIFPRMIKAFPAISVELDRLYTAQYEVYCERSPNCFDTATDMAKVVEHLGGVLKPSPDDAKTRAEQLRARFPKREE